MSTQDKNLNRFSDTEQDELWLLAHGWRCNAEREPWAWYKPPLRGTFYRLKDAVAIERSRSK